MKNFLTYSIVLILSYIPSYTYSFSISHLFFFNNKEIILSPAKDDIEILSSENRKRSLGYGLMSDNSNINKKIVGDSCVVSTIFKYVYLSEVIDDNCIKADGRIDEKKVREKLKKSLDKKLDYKSNKRYVLRIFPSCNASGPINEAKLQKGVNTDDGKLYLWYPSKLYDKEKNSKFNPLVLKWNNSSNFKETKNLSIIDFRNSTFYQLYETVLKEFSDYLKESINAPTLSSYTNASKKCTKGDFISRIEIGFLGPWGEGLTTPYINYTDSKSLISIVELYKKYLHEYWLIAPSFGMCKTGTSNANLYDFEYYLMTTTYGSEIKDDNNLYIGEKELGLFIDHLGHKDCEKDFNITNVSGDNELKQLSQKKYKRAPVIGENSGDINNESKNINKNLMDLGISMIRVWGKVDNLEDSNSRLWENTLNKIGFRLSCNVKNIKVKDQEINIQFVFKNEGNSPCYEEYWIPQLIVRRLKDGKTIIEKNIDLDLKNIKLNSSTLDYSINLDKLPKDDYCLYLRIVDKFHIYENLFVKNLLENKGGEYVIQHFIIK